jgi:hypothetical protein
MRFYDTQAGVPNLVGTIPSGSTISITLWMKKTSAFGTVYPQASVGLNWASQVPFCQATGLPNQTPTQALSTTLTAITISCQTTTAISMTESDRIYVIAGYSMTAGPGNKSMKVELDYEGATPSRAVVPNPIPPTPVITSLNPAAAPLNWPVTIAGTGFGQSPGTVKFYNNISAPIDSWTNTSIQARVPANAVTGPVTVTNASNVTSSGSAFTLLGSPTLTSLSLSAAHVNESITITGTNFMATQSTSTVKFNGTTATPTSWSATSIQVPVPAGATNGTVVVTVSGQPSNGLPFTVIPPPAIASAVPSSAQVGAPITISGSHLGATQGASTVTFNNGIPATATTWSDTRITTTVPVGASTGNIVVSVANQASNGFPFTVLVAGTMSGTSQNTVTFNGAGLSVTSATATQIAATIPAGAPTGTPYPFVVTTPTGSATSLASFTVVASGPPTITGVTPSTAASGTALAIDGTNFETVAANNNLRVNLSPVQVTSAMATSLQGAVPPSATAGRVSVSTPNGTATSTDYLWVAPPPYPATALDTTGTLTFGTAATFSVAINKIALRVFEGTEASRVSMKMTGVTGGQANVYLYEPFGTALQTTFVSTGSGFMEPVNLRVAATYSVVFDPSTTTQVAGGTITVYEVPADFSDTITPDETVTVEIIKPGQNGTLTFAGTAQQRVSLQGTNGTIFGQIVGCDVNVSILKPDGTVLAPATCMEGTGFIDTVTLPTAGTYRIVVDPVTTAIGNLPLTLRSITDVTGTIGFGSPLPWRPC